MPRRWRRARLREVRALADARALLARVPEGLPEDTLRGMLEARRHSPATARRAVSTLRHLLLARAATGPGGWPVRIILRHPQHERGPQHG